jgi:hypothetical protein
VPKTIGQAVEIWNQDDHNINFRNLDLNHWDVVHYSWRKGSWLTSNPVYEVMIVIPVTYTETPNFDLTSYGRIHDASLTTNPDFVSGATIELSETAKQVENVISETLSSPNAERIILFSDKYVFNDNTTDGRNVVVVGPDIINESDLVVYDVYLGYHVALNGSILYKDQVDDAYINEHPITPIKSANFALSFTEDGVIVDYDNIKIHYLDIENMAYSTDENKPTTLNDLKSYFTLWSFDLNEEKADEFFSLASDLLVSLIPFSSVPKSIGEAVYIWNKNPYNSIFRDLNLNDWDIVDYSWMKGSWLTHNPVYEIWFEIPVTFTKSPDFNLSFYARMEDGALFPKNDFVTGTYNLRKDYAGANTVLASNITGSQNQYTNPIAALGNPDNNPVCLGESGFIVLDLGQTNQIVNNNGDDFTIHEAKLTQKTTFINSDEGYIVYVSESDTINWMNLGNGAGTQSFDLNAVGLNKAQFMKIVDDGDTDLNTQSPGFALDAITINQTSTRIENDNVLINDDYILYQNYPNPFNPVTKIEYYLPTLSNVRLEIYNLLGQKIRTLIAQKQTKGKYIVYWDGKNNSGEVVSSGIYIYQLKTENYVITKKMVFLR